MMLQKPYTRPLGKLWIAVVFTLVLVSTVHARTIETVIPADSFLYLKLQNLDISREAIEKSDSWKTAAAIITTAPKWQPVNQFMQTLLVSLDTDIQGFIETFLTDEVALTVSQGAEGVMIGLVVQNTDKTQAAEQMFVKLTQNFADMVGSQIPLSKADYQNTHYYTVQINEQEFSYGSVGDLFLIGSPTDSFKKMIDVYKTEKASIIDNPAYLSVGDTHQESEIFAFVDVSMASFYLKSLLPSAINGELEAFDTLVYSWELLRPGGRQRLYGQLNPSRQDTLISHLKTDMSTQTTQGLSGTEELFLACPPSTASVLWQAILGTRKDFSSAINRFLFPPPDALQTALAGELCLVIDISNVKLHSSHLLSYDLNQTQGIVNALKIDFPELNVGFIFKPDTPQKWQEVFNQFLKKMTVHSRRQTDYRGITCNAVSIPGTLYYGNIAVSENEFFLLAFSEQQFKTMINNLLAVTPMGDLQQQLAAFTTPPAGLVQLNLGASVNAAAQDNPWITPEVVRLTKEIEALLASLVVQEDTAWIEIAHAPDEKGIDVMGKLAPLVFLMITQEMELEK